ncbi:hypothetical protein ABEP17_06105 [Priestia flexa]|uniref:Uncharacterized protein n=1 Tax=Priestia flexa TaxID=86664 RepID=A0ABU4J082_9BACI|nr:MULTISPECIES: hypothetical protein [Bacillaceae]MDW8514670.1 hypothetical protein [Priestia flexa]MEC0666468.1 hypothetical protein [Priestia flexa]MED3824847.1 hypothetical protein [Priestia flexa]MED4590155.1 hypothetical protein [Priestia flexa]UZW65510.1 hypothetical protein OC195_15505 [Priestia flexa]
MKYFFQAGACVILLVGGIVIFTYAGIQFLYGKVRESTARNHG